MPSFNWHDDGYVSSEDKSTVPCLWKSCGRPISPSELYCSNGCRAKAKSLAASGTLHQEGAKKHKPNWVYMNVAYIVDEEARRALVANKATNFKLQAHKKAWESSFSFMKPTMYRNGIRQGRNGF